MFAPPPVEVGQVILWAQDGYGGQQPAVVIKVSSRSLCVAVFADGYTSLMPRDGVFHAEDPDRRKFSGQDYSSGCWRLTHRDEAINRILAKVAEREAATGAK